ncbi:MAG: nitrate reductase molybdenum cofactor assembly chaperone, partial [Enterobacterales bacterium]|nr:nitrate reductase molybdenum cofactor assembly chaperone [Enterobacterales bacterium]
MMTLRIIARLLDYPDEALWENRQELVTALDDASELTLAQSVQLLTFIRDFTENDLMDVQAQYCELFDRGRATSLLLFEHVHGESRDRGQAMVDLMAQYNAAGLEIDSRELPDFLPMYLEFLASRDRETARQGLLDIVPILALLGARLKDRQSHYAVLFDLLLAVSGTHVASEQLSDKVAQE